MVAAVLSGRPNCCLLRTARQAALTSGTHMSTVKPPVVCCWIDFLATAALDEAWIAHQPATCILCPCCIAVICFWFMCTFNCTYPCSLLLMWSKHLHSFLELTTQYYCCRCLCEAETVDQWSQLVFLLSETKIWNACC